MATSPNYGWLEPDNTDLVKNGALAIRTLGNAIDTTMATMVPKTIVDAKGDLIAGTAADTAARLAVGNNGETIVADSSTSTGLRYQGSMAAGKNAIINGGFDIWQRGTSSIAISALGTYTADRWQAYRNVSSTSTVSRQLTNDSTNLPFIQYCARVQRDSGNTSTGNILFVQSSETVNAIPYAGKQVTLSFYARAGANYSATSGALGVLLNTGTGTDQNALMSGYTGTASTINQTATLTTTWQRFTYTATLPTTTTEFAPYFTFAPTGTAGANDYYEITGVQVEVGSVATQFTRTGGSIQGELAACQRYYAKSYSQGTAVPTNATGAGLIFTASGNLANNDSLGTVAFPVVMRTAPTVTIYSYTTSQTGRLSAGNGTDLAANSGYVDWLGDRGFKIINISGGTVNQAANGFAFHYAASAEL